MHDAPSADPPPPSPAAASASAEAFQELFSEVYVELRAIAQRRMSEERAGHTLHATELVHEVYLRLFAADGRRIDYANRAHFFHMVGEAMRHILIDHARRRSAAKRGGAGAGSERRRTSLTLLDAALPDDPLDLLALDEAFVRLEAQDPRAAEVVRLRYFAGLNIDQTAAAIAVSPRTVKREWEHARAWLMKQLQ